MAGSRRGLPVRPFFYTLDQVADMLNVEVSKFRQAYIWKVGAEVGAWQPRYLRAVQLLPTDWRIGENELLRWMRHTGLYIYDPYLGLEDLPQEEIHDIDPAKPERKTPDAELLAL
ncbi:MAG: hypothetical protein M3O41_00450 [Pseudomonadota bacterium]|nr:hypothetical protein [Pseudomonadota bacterium]